MESYQIHRASHPPLDSAPPLQPRELKMADFWKESPGKKSWVAPAYFLCSCFGKLIFGFGASMAVKGAVGEDMTSLAIGATLSGLGFICIVIVAFGFGAACSRCDRAWGIILKCISITAAVLIATGYAVNQYYISAHHSLLDIRLSIFPLFLGAGLLTISISNFFAYTELVRGVTPVFPLHHRSVIAMCFLGPGLGFVFSGWITGEKGDWPVAFNAAVLTFAMACLYLGLSIFWSDHIRRKAEWSHQRVMLQSYVTDKNFDSPDQKEV